MERSYRHDVVKRPFRKIGNGRHQILSVIRTEHRQWTQVEQQSKGCRNDVHRRADNRVAVKERAVHSILALQGTAQRSPYFQNLEANGH